ncbi:Gfo/Idh/MocA family protein [Paenibacillus koleovorans]|uniref:Gfo/Idh/MocA family protein n=1 Tax=Paenibacillus koleovorans TaxID=121608 RepID=UPI000FD81352|nr:Gfo/Idh/MocA family oxidoreductase [Paenibacillus koleovorans]
MKKTLNVGLIGYNFMGRAHTHGLKNLYMMADDLQVTPRLHTICGRNEGEVERVAGKLGWEKWSTSWESVVDDPEIDIIDIASPGNTHCEIAVAAAQKGKHILCEKPLATTLGEAEQMLAAVESGGAMHLVNFNYRRVPAVMLAKRLIEEGRLGAIISFKGFYQQDWTLDDELPFIWRFDKAVAGAGSMADKGSHIIDLARYLIGEFEEVSAAMEIFVKERPIAGGGQKRVVTTDDAAVFTARFACGALGVFETNRMSSGRKNGLWFEVNGTEGSVRFELERLNELQVYSRRDPEDCQGFRQVLVTQASHPYIRYWWPPGHLIGWEHTFTHQFYELFRAIETGQLPSPNFRDGLVCQKVIEAINQAAVEKRWVTIDR